MTREKAFKILGLSSNSSLEDCKKKYRSLMLMTHPDMNESHDYPYEASEINAAYEYVMNHGLDKSVVGQGDIYRKGSVWRKSGDFHKKRTSKSIKWNASQNPNAYVGRNIFHAVEDSDGIHLGEAVIDHGPYLWSEEEDFSLFLKSLLLAGKEIIERDDARKGSDRSGDFRLLSEIVYLLAQQFVDYEMVLSLLASSKSHRDSEQEQKIYEIDAMLEVDGYSNRGKGALCEGDLLYPSKLAFHRLYVKNEMGKEIGYISLIGTADPSPCPKVGD